MENRCVICNDLIPEGLQVCRICRDNNHVVDDEDISIEEIRNRLQRKERASKVIVFPLCRKAQRNG